MSSDSKRHCCMCNTCNGKFVNIKTFRLHCKNAHDEHINNLADVQNFSDVDHLYNLQKSQDKDVYQTPLFDGSSRTVFDAIAEHMLIFSTNNGMSKAALTECLQHEKHILPQPNLLPATYKEALNIIKPLLMPIIQYKCCINDCKCFPINDDVRNCSVCNELLHYKDSNRCRKTYNYMPVVPRINRWYGTKNLAKLIHADKVKINGQLSDYTDGKIFIDQMKHGIFKDSDVSSCVPLALFTDGVNPNKNTAALKSMWPIILTWITLPQDIRYVLGPMMLLGIVPGHGRKEPKSLDPYISILVDELLVNMESKMYDSHKEAPVTVKIALLQYLCDIPAFSKLLHLSGQAALRSCVFCKEDGVRSNTLNKTLHVCNRQFLPADSPLRLDSKSFAIKSAVNSTRPESFTNEEEMAARREFDQKPNKNQKTNFQKQTGVKGIHPLTSLPYFDRLKQMQTDGMHTISDVISNILDLISGKTDTIKVRNCEKQYQRFEETWPNMKRKAPDAPCVNPSKQRKKTQLPKPKSTPTSLEESPTIPEAPWSLSKLKIKVADKRAGSIEYPKGFDYTPADHFTRQWTLRTMHGKQQFVTYNVAAWCLRGLLGHQQEQTLFQLFTVLSRLVKPTFMKDEIPSLIADTHLAVALLERDFPLTLQNLTTHLLHHIPEGYNDFGPLYDRWLYPLERANSWITRQIVQHGHEESTVMQTYRIYDWSVFNLLSGTVKQETTDRQTSLRRIVKKICNSEEDLLKTNKHSSKTMLPTDHIKIIKEKYCKIFSNSDIEMCDIDPVVESIQTTTRYDKTKRKDIFFATESHQISARSCDFIIHTRDPSKVFGKIKKLYRHSFRNNVYTWVLLDRFPLAEQCGLFWFSENKTLMTNLCLLSDISDPLVSAVEEDNRWFLNV
ncbi:uncharacterized protein LOC143075311 isoform X2 [Mytilus galloprovincialis]